MLEYKAITASSLPAPEQITDLTQAGWELVQIVRDERGEAGKSGSWVLYFSREKE